MKFLRMSVDKSNNITLSVYTCGDEVYLRWSHGLHKSKILGQYERATDALKAFDKEVMEDYRMRGIYYDDFYGSD